MARAVMVQGTTSDAGKTVLATGLCRLFARMGYSVAPFKSQNMTQNTQMIPGEGEVARSQVIQARAAGSDPTTDMNPVILKPETEDGAQMVLGGRPLARATGSEYRRDFYSRAAAQICNSYRRLERDYEVIVIEGAGSPVELNLKERELVNMRIAAMADAPVVIIADIERGGVMASIAGTWQLLTPGERDRVLGFLINKFRGDPSLFADGVRMIEDLIPRPVLGVLPYLPIDLEPEDSLSSPHDATPAPRAVALDLPSGGEGEDFRALREAGTIDFCDARRVGEAVRRGVQGVLIPHSDDPVSDMHWLKGSGWADFLTLLARCDVPIIACGLGTALLGRTIHCDRRKTDGLGLLEVEVLVGPVSGTDPGEVRLRLSDEHPLAALDGCSVSGCLPRRLDFSAAGDVVSVMDRDGQHYGVASRTAPVFGTALRDIFRAGDFFRAFCDLIQPASRAGQRERDICLLADTIEREMDMSAVCRAMGLDNP